jgi:YD repeat-containing protein
MASNLRAITDAITNLSVSYTNEAGATITPTAKDINQIPSGVIAAADIPLRLVGIITEGGNTDTMMYDAAGASGEITHTVTELALIENVGLSRTSDELPDQQRYSDAIITTLVSNRSIYTNSDITGAVATRTVAEFPGGTEEFYYAVVTEITIREFTS